MKIRPKILNLLNTRKDIFFGKEGFNSRRIYKALNNGDTNDWIYNWYGFDTNTYTSENFKNWRTLNVSEVKNAPHSDEYRVGLTAQPNDTYNTDSWTNTLALLEKWQGNDNTNRLNDIISAANAYIEECKLNNINPTLEGFIKWYNKHISNMYLYFNYAANRIRKGNSPYFRNNEQTGNFNTTNKLIYPTANGPGYIGSNSQVIKDAGISTWTRFVDATKNNITNLDFSNVEDETLRSLLLGIIKHSSGALGTRTANTAVEEASTEPEIPAEPEIPTEPEDPNEKRGPGVPLDIGSMAELNIKPNRTALIFSNLTPELISASRLWNTIRANNKVYKTLLNALHPTLHNTYERYSPVTGAFNVMQAYNQQATDINRLADRNATADASLNLAARLNANKLANQYRMLGFLADDLQIQKTALAALERLEDNMARRSLVANDNMDSIINTNFNRALLKALRILSNYDAINTFLKEKETDIRAKQQEHKDIYEKINESILSDKLYKGRLDLLTEWLKKYPSDDTYYKAMKNPKFASAAREYTNILTNQAYKNLLYNSYPNLKGKTEEEFWKNLSFERQGGVLSLQHGGNPFANFFVQYESAERPSPKTEKSSSSKAKDKSKGEITDEDFASLLKSANGRMLPNDARYVNDIINEAMYNYKAGMIDTSDAITTYSMILNELNDAAFNKEMFDNVRNKAEKDGTLYEPAISNDGRVLVLNLNDHSLELLSLDDYLDNKNSYSILTNSMVLGLRYNHPNYTNNNDILSIVESGVNLDSINQNIRESLLKIGSSSVEFNLPKGVSAGASLLLNLAQDNPDLYHEIAVGLSNGSDLNKVSLKYPGYDKINAAIGYVWNMLNNNAKTRLLLQTETGSLNDVRKVILGYIMSGIDTSYKQTDLTLKGSGKGSGGGSSNKFGYDNLPLTSAADLIMDRGYEEIKVFNAGNTDGITSLCVKYNLKVKDKPIQSFATYDEAIVDTGINGVVDTNNITIGGKPVKQLQALAGVLIEGSCGYSVPYPCDWNGNPLLDQDTIKHKEEADKEIQKLDKPNDPNNKEEKKEYTEKVNAIYELYGLPKMYNENGEINKDYWKKYAVFDIYFSKDVLGNDIFDRNPYISKVTDKEDKEILKSKLEGKSDFYRGTMWIPVQDSLYNTTYGDMSSMSGLNYAEKRKNAENIIDEGAVNVNSYIAGQ